MTRMFDGSSHTLCFRAGNAGAQGLEMAWTPGANGVYLLVAEGLPGMKAQITGPR